MTEQTILGLMQNAAFLLALTFLFDLSSRRWNIREAGLHQVPAGIFLGLIGCIIMLTPWVLRPGLVFDTRSILLSISGLFFGTIPTIIAMAMTAALRVYQGGVGSWVGVSVIIVSGAIGLAWRHVRRIPLGNKTWQELYLFGIVVHVAMLLAMFQLPWDIALATVDSVGLPTMLVYPVATMVLGLLLQYRLEIQGERERLTQSQVVLTRSQELAGIGHWVLRTRPRRIDWSKGLYHIYGLDPTIPGEELDVLWRKLIHPDDRRRVLAAARALDTAEPPSELEFRIRRTDGAERHILVTALLPKRDDGGAILELTGIVQDITERKVTEESLRASQQDTQRLLDESISSRRVLLSMLEDQKETDAKIRESEQRYRYLFESNPHPMWIYNLDTLRFLDVNDAAVRHYGYSKEEFQGMTIADIRPEEDVPKLMENVAAAPPEGREESGVWRHRTKEGRIINVEITSHTLDWLGHKAKLVLANDVTEREHAYSALQRSEERLRLALSGARQGLYDLNVKTGETIVTPEYAIMLGYDPGTFVETSDAWVERLHPDDREKTAETYRQYISGKLPKYIVEFRQRTKDGGWKWILSLGTIVERDAAGRPLRMLGTHTDIDARKRAEQSLIDYSRQLEQMTARLQEIREEERKGIARELHDELGQQLTAVKMEIALMERTVRSGLGRSHVIPLDAHMADLRQLVDEAIAIGRRLSLKLRPDVLDKLGFGDAVLWLADDFRERSGISCTVSVPDEASLIRDPVAITLFRIVQEGLTNIMRHAKAQHASIEVVQTNDGWECEISDDGGGFSEALGTRSDAFGLVGIRERVQSLGGSLDIVSVPGRGTTLRVTVKDTTIMATEQGNH